MEDKPLLFITFNEHEQNAMTRALKDAETSYLPEPGIYITKGVFGNTDARHYHCPSQGDDAELHIFRVLREVPCSAIVMVGIACGANVKDNDNSQNIGDILLCKHLINGREKRIGDITIPRGEKVNSGDQLYERFFGAIGSWKTVCHENGCSAKVHAGSIISGAELIDNNEAKKSLFGLFHNEPIGYEMEGTSLFRVCHSREVGKTEWMIVKGISDFGDGNKGQDKEARQILAANHAVAFCLHVFSQGNTTPPSPPDRALLHKLPHIRNRYFTGRENVLKEIHESFASGNTISLTQTIMGLGGVGKTQTALEYAYRYASDYEVICWIPAENESTVIAAYKKFAVKMNLLDNEQWDTERIIDAVFRWIGSHQKWLFIYDNIDEVSGETRWWPRDDNHGNIMVTTRNHYSCMGKGIDISVFTEAEAVSFLEERTSINNKRASAIALSRRLGYLPLALEQAGAYITINKGLTFGDYLTLLDKYGLETLADTKGIIHYKSTVTATMELSIKKINNITALQILNLCAYLAPDDIRRELFTDNLKHLPDVLQRELSHDLKANAAWGQLVGYSLLKTDDSKSYSMHRLLQEVVREKQKPEAQFAQLVLHLLCDAFDFNYGDIKSHKHYLQLSPHVEAFVLASADMLSDDRNQTGIAYLCSINGLGNDYLGNYAKALVWHEKSLAIDEKVLGKEHPNTASSYNNIAEVYATQGKYSKALEWHEEALAIREKVLGNEHPNTANSYNNIAEVYNHQGEYTKALVWHEKALAIREKVLGNEHPDTANSYNNIALVYANQGNYAKALDCYEKALAIIEKVLGKEHPHTATAYNNIAGVYNNQGEYTKALEWLEKALAIREKVLGNEHPDTASPYNNIAGVYYDQGEYSKALEWYEKALAICEKVLGKDHPNTITVTKNMAISRRELEAL